MSKIKKSTPRAQRRKIKRASTKMSQPSANRKYSSSSAQRRESERVAAKQKSASGKGNEEVLIIPISEVSFFNLDVVSKANLLVTYVFGENEQLVQNEIDRITTEHAAELVENQISFYFNKFRTEDLVFLSPFDPETASVCLLNLYKVMMINKAPLPPHKSLLLDACILEQDDLFEKLKPQRSIDDAIVILEGYFVKLMPETHIKVIEYIKKILQKKPNALLFELKDKTPLSIYFNDDFDTDYQIRCINIFYLANRLRSMPQSDFREILEYGFNAELQLLINLMQEIVNGD